MTESVCVVDDCGTSQYRNTKYCHRHWKRWKRHGDPLAGRTSVGEPLAFIERAVEFDSDGCLLWPYKTTGAGYGQVWIDGGYQPAHRVVLTRTSGPPSDESMYAAHAPLVCHNPTCVNPRHVRWATPQENQADRVIDGTHSKGEFNTESKLTVEQVLSIREDERPCSVIAADYPVSEANVRLIQRRERWAWLDDEAVAS